MVFEQEMAKNVEWVEQILEQYMPKERSFQKTVIEAMEYTMSAGGKRIRPVLMKTVYEMLGGTEQYIEPFVAAIEMIHTYSLIHDDLPALDNDDYRRGKKTAHIVYGEAMAILAGDSLLNYAYETAAKAFSLIAEWKDDDLNVSNQTIETLQAALTLHRNIERAMSILASKPGIYGMIGGQVADVELTGSQLDNEQLTYIYENKTGALIEASMVIGAILANADGNVIEIVQKIAYNIGMAFQIQDDILDEIATFEELGKPIHSDLVNEKVTYVTIHGIQKAQEQVKRLSNEALRMVDSLDGNGDFLKKFIEFLIHRKN